MRPAAIVMVAAACAATLWLMFPDDRLLGRMHESGQRYAQAVEALERWSRAHPRDRGTRWHTAELYLEMGDPGGALRTLHAMILDWPGDPRLRRAAIEVHESRNDVRGTVAEYEALAALLPEDVGVARRLVELYRFFEDDAAHLDALRRWVRLAPEAPARDELVELLVFHGELAEAEGLLRPQVEATPDAPRLRERLAALYRRMRRTDDAVVQLRAAVALQPALDGPFDDLVATLLGAGRTDEAVAAWERRLGHGDDAELRRRFARFLLGRERWSEAAVALRASPDDAETRRMWRTVSWHARQAGDRGAAIDALERAVR